MFVNSSLPTPSGNLEIVFSFDTTGSMCMWLNQLRGRIQDMIQRLQADIPGIKMAVFAHGDYCDTHIYVTKWTDLTNNIVELCNFVKNAEQTGGGDAPECYELVLRQVRTELSWTPGSRRVLVLIDDDNPHEPRDIANKDNIDWRVEVKALAQEAVTIYGVQCGHNTYADKFYQSISLATGGKHLRLEDFGSLFDTLMAVCYREGHDTAMLANYEKEVRARCVGGALAADIDAIFASLRDDNVDSSVLPPVDALTTVALSMKPITSLPLPANLMPTLAWPVNPMPTLSRPVSSMFTLEKAVNSMSTLAWSANLMPTLPRPVNTMPTLPLPVNPMFPLPLTVSEMPTLPRPANPMPTLAWPANAMPTLPLSVNPMPTLPLLVTPVSKLSLTRAAEANRRRKTLSKVNAQLNKFKVSNLPLLKRENVPENNFNLRSLSWSPWRLAMVSGEDLPKDNTGKWIKRVGRPGYRLKMLSSSKSSSMKDNHRPALFEVAVQGSGGYKKRYVVFSAFSSLSLDTNNWERRLLGVTRSHVDYILRAGGRVFVRFWLVNNQSLSESPRKYIRRYDYAWKKVRKVRSHPRDVVKGNNTIPKSIL